MASEREAFGSSQAAAAKTTTAAKRITMEFGFTIKTDFTLPSAKAIANRIFPEMFSVGARQLLSRSYLQCRPVGLNRIGDDPLAIRRKGYSHKPIPVGHFGKPAADEVDLGTGLFRWACFLMLGWGFTLWRTLGPSLNIGSLAGLDCSRIRRLFCQTARLSNLKPL